MATYTWASTSSGDWNSSGNWTPAGIPNGASAYAEIGNGDTTTTITIGAGTSDLVSGISITTTGPTIVVDGTLDFTGSAGSISQGTYDYASMLVNGGNVVNGGSIDPLVQVTNSATFTGTNAVDFTNELQVLSASTAVVNTASIAGLSGTTLSAGVFNPTGGGIIDLGGSAQNVDIATLVGPTAAGSYSDLILLGSGSDINEWNGSAYVPIEQTLATIQTGGTLHSLNRDYTTTNNILLDGGAIILANNTFTSGTVTIQNGGRLLGNTTTITSDIVNNGTVQAGSNQVVLEGSLGGTGVLDFYSPEPAGVYGTIEVTGATANNATLLTGSVLQLDDPAGFTGTVNAPVGGNIILGGITNATTAVLSGTTLDIENGSSILYGLQMAGDYTGDSFSVAAVGGGTEITVQAGGVTCFAHGTRIRTPDGDVPVEKLAVGQLVVTASGKTEAVKWIGRRRINCRRHPAPQQVQPVRIRAGAFGPMLPQRDLLLSPQHAVYDEGVLIPARYLINGSTVTQEQVPEVEYFHIELAQHDLLLAEGLPAESYLENNDRNTFENTDAAMVLHPDLSRWSWDSRACAELKVVGPEVDAVRAKLQSRTSRAVAA